MAENVLLTMDPGLISEFLEESLESLSGIEGLIIRLENEPKNQDLINQIFRPAHSIKGNAPFFGFTRIRTLAHAVESLLALLRAGSRDISKQVTSILLEGTDELRRMLERSKEQQPEVIDEAAFLRLLDRVRKAEEEGPESLDQRWQDVLNQLQNLHGQILSEAPMLHEIWEEFRGRVAALAPGVVEVKAPGKETVSGQTHEQKEAQVVVQKEHDAPSQPEVKSAETRKSMRVSEEHIDTFLAYVGELIVVGEMLSHLHKRVAGSSVSADIITDFKRINEAFVKLSDDLQRSIMSIRKVPLRGMLQKAHRTIRDLAVQSGKEIDVVVRGEDLQIDKSLAELLDAPLIHMARNAADHGIEAAGLRLQKSKPATGKVEISVEEQDAYIVLVLEDDGAGLKVDALREKAEKMGLIRGGESLSQDQLASLIFAPGVSTAEKVTDVSGRGVGMDVVKRMIESAGGRISIATVPDRGTRFEIKVPKSVTTQIMKGLVVDIADGSYIIPLERVIEASKTSKEQLHFIPGRGECVERHGKIEPVVSLASFLKLDRGKDTGDSEFDLLVSVSANKKEIALRVDQVLGVQQIVLKKIEGLNIRDEVFSGSAILGDGRVGLILDLDKFCAAVVQ